MTVKVVLNKAKILDKVQNDKFGLFCANEWKRLIDPYTPQRKGQLIGRIGIVEIKPFEIHYKAPYSEYVYNSNGWNFYQELSPYATDHWDEKAEYAGQKDKLIKTLNAALQSGIF